MSLQGRDAVNAFRAQQRGFAQTDQYGEYARLVEQPQWLRTFEHRT